LIETLDLLEHASEVTGEDVRYQHRRTLTASERTERPRVVLETSTSPLFNALVRGAP
jgi:hypothetical protein